MARRYKVGDFELHPDERRLSVSEEPVPMGARAFDLLVCLVERRDRIVGKDELMEQVWPGVVVEENNLTVQVSALRKLLGAVAVATIPGRGYRFALPVSEVDIDVEPPLSERPSIAVLPFDVLSDDPHIGFLSDGLVEDVIALLARVPGFLLISRFSSFEFRRREQGIAAIASQLGVRYIVEGSVRPAGRQVRVSTRLVDAQSGRVLWSGRFDGDRGETADLQEAIVRGIISELEPELMRAEMVLIRRQRPESVDAWGHYRQAVAAIAMQGWTAVALGETRAHMLQALAIDPSFSLVRAHFSVITSLGIETGLIAASEAAVDEALQAAEQALNDDEDDSQVLGYAACTLSDLGQHERAIGILQQALAIDPSNAQAHVAIGAAKARKALHAGQTASAECDEWIESMRYGMRISPRDRRLGFWGSALGAFLLRAGHAELALQEARSSAQRDPRLYLARLLQAVAAQRLGHDDEAIESLAAARRLFAGLTIEQVAVLHGRRVARSIEPLWIDGGSVPAGGDTGR